MARYHETDHGPEWTGSYDDPDEKLRELERSRRGDAAEITRLMNALEAAWGIIANVSGGHWMMQSAEWVEAARRFRDEQWHPALDRNGYPSRGEDARKPDVLSQVRDLLQGRIRRSALNRYMPCAVVRVGRQEGRDVYQFDVFENPGDERPYGTILVTGPAMASIEDVPEFVDRNLKALKEAL